MNSIIVLGPTRDRAKHWSKTHIKAHERMPVCISSLNQLRGTRDRVIIILPEVVLEMDQIYILDRNTIIDLRGVE